MRHHESKANFGVLINSTRLATSIHLHPFGCIKIDTSA